VVSGDRGGAWAGFLGRQQARAQAGERDDNDCNSHTMFAGLVMDVPIDP